MDMWNKLFSPYLGSEEVIPAEDLIKDVPHQLLAPGGGEPVPGPGVQHAGQDVLEEGGQQRQVDAAPHGAQVALGGANCQILDEGLLHECPDLLLEVDDGSSNNILCNPKTSNQTRSLSLNEKTVIEMKI